MGCEAAQPYCSSCTRDMFFRSSDAPEYFPKSQRQELREVRESGPPRSGDEASSSPQCLSADGGSTPASDTKPQPDVGEPRAARTSTKRWTQQAAAVARARAASISSQQSLHLEEEPPSAPPSTTLPGPDAPPARAPNARSAGGVGLQEGESSPSREFTVTLQKHEGARLGADVDPQGDELVVLEIVDGGLVKKWNEQHPEAQIHMFDHIVQVNRVRGNVNAMALECKKCGDLSLTIRRTEPNRLQSSAR